MLAQVVVMVRMGGRWVPAGLLRHFDDGRPHSVFRYGRRYLERDDAYAIDPVQLPLRDAQIATEEGFALFNGIRDAGPDRWGRYLLERRFGRALDELGYVAGTTSDRVGALAFAAQADAPPAQWTPEGFVTNSPDRPDLAACVGAVEDAVKNEETARLRRLIEYGPSLGGARPKASLVWNGSPHLAKFSLSLDTRDEPRLEYAAMSLARHCGLDVPELALTEVDGRSVYLVRRFDRAAGDEPIAFISALTATGLHESDYRDWSYLRLCDAIVRLCADPERDLRELFRRLVFNVLVLNNDDHPRNFGFLYAGAGRWRLSPLYDVVPASVRGESHHLAMEAGAEGKSATLRNALSACERFRLDAADARELSDEMRETVATTWAAHFRACGVRDEGVAALRRNFERDVGG